jgi:hypothetical protein
MLGCGFGRNYQGGERTAEASGGEPDGGQADPGGSDQGKLLSPERRRRCMYVSDSGRVNVTRVVYWVSRARLSAG